MMTNPKTEIRKPKSEWRPSARILLGLRDSVWFRISDFGFRIWTWPS